MNKPLNYTPEQIAQMLDGFGELKAWISCVEEYALDQLTNGNPIPGYELGTTRSTRVWVDEAKVIKTLKKHHFKLDDIKPRQLLSVAQMEKLIKNLDVVSDLVGSKQGNPKVVKIKVAP